MVGDWAIFNGSVWQKVDQTNTVSSVNGQTGVVVLTQTDIAGTASLTTIQTLTNKTLTSPSINEILDANGNEILGLSTTASAVDFLTIKNGIGVGVPLHIYADGSSTNVGLHIQPKGSGLVTISDGTDFNKGIRFRSSGSSASAVTLLDAVATAGRVVTLPDATTTLVGRDTTDTLTNKTIAFSSNTFSGTLPITNGGTGQATASAAFNALSPVTAAGDLIIGDGANSSTRLAIGANGYLLTSNGTTASWAAAPAAGVTSFSAGTTGFTPNTGTTGAVTLAGTLATTNGGTGLTSFTANGITYASSTSALATGSALTFDGTNLSTTGQVISTKTGSATDGAGQVYLNGSTSNRVEWSAVGTGAPAFTTRSAGTKALLYPAISGSQVDYAIGINAATLWQSVPVASSSFYFKWYGGETPVATLDGTGAFTAIGGISGGTF